MMKRMGLAVLIGIVIEAVVWGSAFVHFWPSGIRDFFGMVGLVSLFPGGWLADSLHLTGFLEFLAFFLIPALVYATLAWSCMLGFAWRRRKKLPSKP